MPLSRLLALTITLLVFGEAALASEQVAPPDSAAVQPGSELPAGSIPAPPDSAAVQPGSELPAGSIPAPMPPEPLAAELLQPGFGLEFTERLSAEGKMRGADRADRAALEQFYRARGDEPVWVTPTGFTHAAQVAMAEIRRADDWGLDASEFKLPVLVEGTTLAREQRADAEIELSLAVLQYARHARGGRVNPLRVSRNLDRQPQLLDPRDVIAGTTATDSPDAYLRSLHPQHPQFERLRQHYLASKRSEPVDAKQAARSKGRPGKKSRKAEPPAGRILQTLLVNMEQWRWMPRDLGHFYVWANIPEYTVRVVKDGDVIHSERMVVGRTSTQTPVFSDEMEQVIFHPYWGVPSSIKKNELMPSLARGNVGILERNNLRISYRGRNVDPSTVDWTRVDLRKFHVYQPPGRDNVLGVVKFRFPNKHDVYMHDTPSKRLFNASMRAFSHGCMRVRDPVKLAGIVLAEDHGWSTSRVEAAVRRGPKDNAVNLTNKVPVHVTYFTAWVEDDGKLNIHPDVYGHEPRIALGITGKAHLIRREREAAPPPVVEATRPQRAHTASSSNKEWMQRVFQQTN